MQPALPIDIISIIAIPRNPVHTPDLLTTPDPLPKKKFHDHDGHHRNDLSIEFWILPCKNHRQESFCQPPEHSAGQSGATSYPSSQIRFMSPIEADSLE